MRKQKKRLDVSEHLLNDGTCTDTVPDNSDCNEKPEPYLVHVDAAKLNIRKGPGINCEKTGEYALRGVAIVVDTCEGEGSETGWGLLDAYADGRDGWICLDYCSKRVE